MFSRRTAWDLRANRYSEALAASRLSGRKILDLTSSNPTAVGLHFDCDKLLTSLAQAESLKYDPQPKGLEVARNAVGGYYAKRGVDVSSDDIFLTASTSEAYSFVFRLLCDPGDTVLVPMPSYPLFEFLGNLQDIQLAPYELIYDHGWQIDFHAMNAAMHRATASGSKCRAVLVVHPNNPTGSYVHPNEAQELANLCATQELAIVADEVFLDYSLTAAAAMSFAAPSARCLTFALSGVSKISGLPQMKLAWIVVQGPDELKREAAQRLEVIADTFLSVSTPIQLAAPAMLDERHSIQRQLRQRIEANLAELDRLLASQCHCERLHLEGGWYATLRVPATCSDEELAICALEQAGVLVQPGHFFDFPGEGYLVVSLITPEKDFTEGLRLLLGLVMRRNTQAHLLPEF